MLLAVAVLGPVRMSTLLRVSEASPGSPRYVYPGVVADAELLSCRPLWDDQSTSAAGTGEVLGGAVLGLVDLPFCLALDTLLLPSDLYQVTAGGKTCRRTGFAE